MPDYSDLSRLQMPTMGGGRPGFSTAPAIPKPIKYPELDIGGLQDWLSSMMGRQLMPGKLTPERIGGITNQMLGPLMQMKAQYPFQKYGAETQQQQWGYGAELQPWSQQYGTEADMWKARLMAMLQLREMSMREKMFERESMSPMERYGGPYNLRP